MFNIGDVLVCRCPKCGSGDLSISEIFQVSDVTSTKNGVVDQPTFPAENPFATGAVWIHCDKCEHNWRSRRSIDELEFIEP